MFTDGTLAGALYFMTPLSLQYALTASPRSSRRRRREGAAQGVDTSAR